MRSPLRLAKRQHVIALEQRPVGLGLERLTAADVSAFLARECPRRSVGGARKLVESLRPLLRYLHVTGLIDTPLVWAVPGVADLRDRSLPRGLEPEVVARLLASCDRRRTVGRRDYAILLLLGRLGLRAGEVGAIELEDLDWRRGEIVIRGKGDRRVHGDYREIVPNERIVSTEVYEGAPEAESLNTLTLTERDGRTTMTCSSSTRAPPTATRSSRPAWNPV